MNNLKPPSYYLYPSGWQVGKLIDRTHMLIMEKA